MMNIYKRFICCTAACMMAVTLIGTEAEAMNINTNVIQITGKEYTAPKQNWTDRYERFLKKNSKSLNKKSIKFVPVYINNDNIPEIVYYDKENLGIFYINDKNYVKDTGISDKQLFSYIPKKNRFRCAYYDNSNIKSKKEYTVYESINKLDNGVKSLINGYYKVGKNNKVTFYRNKKKVSRKDYLKKINKIYDFETAEGFNDIKDFAMSYNDLQDYLKNNK